MPRLAALLHDPEVLILDEPFSGLDVNTTMVVRSLLKSMARRGKILLYSSHVLKVVEMICHTVLILRKGQVSRTIRWRACAKLCRSRRSKVSSHNSRTPKTRVR